MESPYREPIQATVARLQTENEVLRRALAVALPVRMPRRARSFVAVYAVTVFATVLLIASWSEKASIRATSRATPAVASSRAYAQQAEGYRRACDAGDWNACTDLGSSYWSGQGVAKDSAQAATLYSTACELGNARGCRNLASLYLRGDGVARDRDRAAHLYRKACAWGELEACPDADRRR